MDASPPSLPPLQEIHEMYDSSKTNSFPEIEDIEPEVIVVVGFFFLFFFSNSFIFEKHTKQKEVVQRLLENDPHLILVDCREEEEQQISTIEGQETMPLPPLPLSSPSSFANLLLTGSISSSLFDISDYKKEDTIVFFCTIGVRSGFVVVISFYAEG